MASSLRQVLLDTTVVVEAFRHNAAILQRLTTVQSIVSATVLGELYYGARRAAFIARELQYIADLITYSIVVGCDSATAEQYGTIRDMLERQGQRIPENDLWIAASALQHGLPLATLDPHFQRVPGLIVERW